MDSHLRKNRLGAPSQPLPEFDNLEIQCIWDGEFSTPVNVRVSLEVRCVPNTQLQLLSTRPASILHIDTLLDRLPSNKGHLDNETTSDSPQSPLFAFSPLVSNDENLKGSSMNLQSPSKDNCGTETDSKPETPSPQDTSNKEGSQDYPNDQSLESTLGNSVFSDCSASLPSGSRECINTASSRKRSATDADLPDPRFEIDTRNSSSKEGYKSSINCISPIRQTCSEGNGKRRTKLPQLATPQGKHSRKSSLIPKLTPRAEKNKNERLTEEGISKAEECNSDVASVTETRSNPRTEDSDIEQTYRCLSTPTFSQTEDSHTQVSLLGLDSESNTGADTRRSNIDLSMGEHAFSCAARLNSLVEQPDDLIDLTPCQEVSIRKQCEPSCEPQVVLVDGILTLRNSANVHSAHYKIAITASITLNGNAKGWQDLVIPGLPKLRGGKFGYFLFLLPEEPGLEFRTTNLHRHKIVESCFFAEFSSSSDLVVPVRKCDKKFYGIIRGFTIDQEVRAHYTVKPAMVGESQNNHPTVSARYNAVCSLRLHNRCFATEKCCFFLYLDGGPQGEFRCELESRQASLPMIHVEADIDKTAGVSRIQVICSPKDLDIFCVTWSINIPRNQPACWLPRLRPESSGSCERIRDHLRLILTEREEDPLCKITQGSGDISKMQHMDSDSTIHSCELTAETKSKLKEQSPPLTFPWLPYQARLSELWSGSVSKAGQIVRSLLSSEDRNWSTLPQRKLAWILCIPILLYSMILLGLANSPHLNSSSHGVEVFTLPLVQEQVPAPILSQAHANLWHRYARKYFSAGESEAGESDSTKDNFTVDVELDEQAHTPDLQFEDEAVADDQNDTGTAQEVENDTSDDPTSGFSLLAFRDAIDYWLGWRGPTGSRA